MCKPYYYTSLSHHNMLLFQPNQLTKEETRQAERLSQWLRQRQGKLQQNAEYTA